jgi:uncharacterized protein (DUF1810 family)
MPLIPCSAPGCGPASAQEVFGSPDDLKYRSCLTLFARATGEPVFRAGLARYFGDAEDPLTVAALGG